MQRILIIVFVASAVFFSYCSENKSKSEKDSPIRFSSLPSSSTHIDFKNVITEDDTVSVVNNAYAYMGSGVGIGDFNKDGLPDVFFWRQPVIVKIVHQ